MKHKNTLIVAALVAASIAPAFAAAPSTNIVTNPVLYIGGSQAFSALDNAALSSYAAANNYTLVASTANATPTKAKALLYRRTNAPVVSGLKTTLSVDIINVHQTGSEAGLRSAAGDGNQLVCFLPNDASGLALSDVPATYSSSNQAVISTSPVQQASSRYRAGAKEGSVKFKALSEIGANNAPGIAAQTFGWSASANFPTSAANISDSTALSLLEKGNVPLSYFTGNPADTNHGVWLIGRDIAAGARIAALTVGSGYGGLVPVNQYHVVSNNGAVALAKEAAATVNGAPEAAGNGGYDGTSTQLAAAKTVLPANLQVDQGSGFANSPYPGTNYLIQYNGYAQTVGQTNANGTPSLIPLSFNGVAPSTNGVVSGAYTFWTYEHIYIAPKYKNTNTPAVANYVAQYIQSLTSAQLTSVSGSTGYLNTQDLQVYRNSDAGKIYSK